MGSKQVDAADAQRRRDFGTLLKKIRKDRGVRRFTQKKVAELVGCSAETYGKCERGTGKRWLSPENLLKFRDTMQVRRDEWEEIRDLYLPHQSVGGDALECWIRDETRDSIEPHPSLHHFYDATPRYIPRSHGAERWHWKVNLFRFQTPPVKIATGAVQWSEKIREARLPQEYIIPYFGEAAAKILQDALGDVGLKSAYDRCKMFKDRDAKENIILVGGPSHNDFSESVNQRFSQQRTWFKGFYYSRSAPPPQWSIRHHLHPEIDITSADVYYIDDKGEETYYRELEDKLVQDYALVYIGPNPFDPKHWLIMLAGIGSVGTFGAAKALQNPDIVEFFGRGLTTTRWYCSGLIRYRCSVDEIEKGCVSSIFLTRGRVR